MRAEITISFTVPDDTFDRSDLLSKAKPARDAFVAKLVELSGGEVKHDTKVLPMRKAKFAPDPATMVTDAPPPADQPLAGSPIPTLEQIAAGAQPVPGPAAPHGRRHPQAAE